LHTRNCALTEFRQAEYGHKKAEGKADC
jgi:hypothetical protein